MWEDGIKVDLKEVWCEAVIGFSWFKIRINGGLL